MNVEVEVVNGGEFVVAVVLVVGVVVLVLVVVVVVVVVVVDDVVRLELNEVVGGVEERKGDDVDGDHDGLLNG